jgi:uncharacterized protein
MKEASNVREETNAEVIRRLFDAVERRDPAGVLSLYDGSVVINEAPSLPYGGEYSGPDAALRHALGYRTTWDRRQTPAEMRLDPQIIAQGDHVVVLWRQRGHDPKTGETFDWPAVSVYRLAEGKIVESRMFHFDTARMLAFLQAGER